MKQKNKATVANSKIPDEPVNIIQFSEKDLSKLKKVKEGENFHGGDFLFIIDNKYAQIPCGGPLLKKKICKDNIVYRKK